MGYIHLVGKKFTGWKNKFFFFLNRLTGCDDHPKGCGAVPRASKVWKVAGPIDQSEWDPESAWMDAGNEYLTFWGRKHFLQIDTLLILYMKLGLPAYHWILRIWRLYQFGSITRQFGLKLGLPFGYHTVSWYFFHHREVSDRLQNYCSTWKFREWHVLPACNADQDRTHISPGPELLEKFIERLKLPHCQQSPLAR